MATPTLTVSPRALEARQRRRAVLRRARSVFEDLATARDWLQTPNRALGGNAPAKLLRSKTGTRDVLEVLGRVDQDLYS